MKKGTKKIFFSVLFFAMLVLLLGQTSWGKNVFLFLFSPCQKISYSLSNRLSLIIQAEKGKPINCPAANWQKNILEAKNKVLEQENKSLKNKVHFLSQNHYLNNKNKFFVSAYVVGKDPTDPANLIIKAGSDQGIKKGMPVIKGKGVLVGKIIKVEKNFSYIQLITDNLSEISASFLKDKKVQIDGIVQGSYNLALLMKFIPLNKKIEKGDIVITSGADQYIPRGLIIGKIVDISKKDDGIFQTAQLVSPFSLNNIYFATILK